MTSELITSKKEMKVSIVVNRDNAMTANNFEHISRKNADGTPMRVRRNGKTKTWKRQPQAFLIPVKRGLYDFGYISDEDCQNWVLA